MRKAKYLFFATVMTLAISSCNKPSGESEKPFQPGLDTQTECTIKVRGHYDSFEALDDTVTPVHHGVNN